MDDQNKNLLLATSLSFLVLLGWMLMFPPEPIEEVTSEQKTEQATQEPCLLYTSPSPRDNRVSRMPSSA